MLVCQLLIEAQRIPFPIPGYVYMQAHDVADCTLPPHHYMHGILTCLARYNRDPSMLLDESTTNAIVLPGLSFLI